MDDVAFCRTAKSLGRPCREHGILWTILILYSKDDNLQLLIMKSR